MATGAVVKSTALPATMAAQPIAADVGSGSVWNGLSNDLQVSPDGRTVAVAEGNDVALFDAGSLTEIRRLRGHRAPVRSLQFSPNGTVLASGSADHNVVLWDVATGGAIQTLAGHTDTVLALAFSPDGGTLYSGSLDRHVLVWDLTGRRQFLTRIVDPAPPTLHAGAAVPSPNGRVVGYPASGGNLRFLDVATGDSVRRNRTPVARRCWRGSPTTIGW